MKTIIATTLAAAAMVAAPALAQEKPSPAGAGLTYALDADVGVVCGVYNTGGATVAVPFGDLAVRTASQRTEVSAKIVYRCNTVGGFTRTITSANDGALVRQGEATSGANRIAYRFSETSTDRNLSYRDGPLTMVMSEHAGSQAFLTGVESVQSFNVPGVLNTRGGFADGAPGTTVFAGDYTDTVTVSITAK
jgi:spore coat protein U-like protein